MQLSAYIRKILYNASYKPINRSEKSNSQHKLPDIKCYDTPTGHFKILNHFPNRNTHLNSCLF